MTTMLEKMARAMARMDDCDPAAVTNPRYWGLARAALQAIREPDEAIQDAFYEATTVTREGAIRDFNKGVTAMIDAILEEKPE